MVAGKSVPRRSLRSSGMTAVPVAGSSARVALGQKLVAWHGRILERERIAGVRSSAHGACTACRRRWPVRPRPSSRRAPSAASPSCRPPCCRAAMSLLSRDLVQPRCGGARRRGAGGILDRTTADRIYRGGQSACALGQVLGGERRAQGPSSRQLVWMRNARKVSPSIPAMTNSPTGRPDTNGR